MRIVTLRRIVILTLVVLLTGQSTAVFAAPYTLTNNGLTLDEAAQQTITATDLYVVDDADALASDFTFVVTAVPVNGTLALNGTSLNVSDSFSRDDIDNNLVTYSHNGSETTSDSFTFDVIAPDTSTIFTGELFTINVTAVNDPPQPTNDSLVVDEGGTVTQTVESETSLLANDTDPENDTLTLTTTPITAPQHASNLTLNANGTFSYTHNGSENFTDSFSYQVCDSGIPSECATATVNITIDEIVDVAPTVNNQPFEINEMSSEGLSVGTVLVDDIEVDLGYDSLSFAITNGNTDDAFAIDNLTGLITVNNSAPLDIDVNPSFDLTVVVTDSGGGSDSAIITITLRNVNEEPNIPAGQSFSIQENQPNDTVVGTVSASDPDGDDLTFNIANGNTLNAFKIDPDSGEISISNTNVIDFETKVNYSLTVQVQDNGQGNLINSAIVTVMITNQNEAPLLDDQPFSVDENSPIGTSVGVISSDDVDSVFTHTFLILDGNIGNAFSLNLTSGQLTVNNPGMLDYETMPTFNVVVEVTDEGGLKDTATMTINLDPVNEAPYFQLPIPAFEVPENSENGTAVGQVVGLDDDDGDVLQYAILSGNAGNIFAINSSNGQITVNNGSQINYESTTFYQLRVEVRDQMGLTETANVRINVTDVNEKPSVQNGQTFSVVGFSDNGTQVGQVVATDPDAGDSLSYSIIGGNIGNAFTINANNGLISVLTSSALDYEVRPVYNLEIRAVDNEGLEDSETIRINVSQPPEYFSYLPLSPNNYRPDEPNDSCEQGYTILTDTNYKFLHEDSADWYTFILPTSRRLTIEMTNFLSQGQIIAYRGSCSALQFLGNNGNFSSIKTLDLGVQPAGTYFVRVVADGPYSNSNLYNLIVRTAPP